MTGIRCTGGLADSVVAAVEVDGDNLAVASLPLRQLQNNTAP